MNQTEILEVRLKREIQAAPRDDDYRSEFERDYGRLVHAPAFRRLQGKSQVFGAGSGDYYRTRLTHSLEVAQIVRFLAPKLSGFFSANKLELDSPGMVIDPLVVECAALAHDLGHPPFGHTGEDELDKILQRSGLRFEGNAQNFRILMFLEKRTELISKDERKPIDGLNLTAAVLLAVNKYPFLLQKQPETPVEAAAHVSYEKGLYPSEFGYIDKLRGAWGLTNGQRTLEAQLMELCDDIAYSTHDLEDGIRAGKFDPEVLSTEHMYYSSTVSRLADRITAEPGEARLWEGVDVQSCVKEVFGEYLSDWRAAVACSEQDTSRARREIKGIWLGRFTDSVSILKDGDWWRVTFIDRDNQENLDLLRRMIVLKQLARLWLVQDFRVQRHQKRSRYIVDQLWNALSDEETGKKIIPPDWVRRYDLFKTGQITCPRGSWPWERLAADYIAGCTDAYAETLFGELFGGTKYGSLYDRD